jgi:protein-S-isoprenylcysteine O-methyltransferase Ste14
MFQEVSPLSSCPGFISARTGGLLFLLMVIRTRKEETILLAKFGVDYRKYLRSTGKFIPRGLRDLMAR